MSYIWKAKHFNNYYTLNTPIQGKQYCFIKCDDQVISTAKTIDNYEINNPDYEIQVFKGGIINNLNINYYSDSSQQNLIVHSGGIVNNIILDVKEGN